MKKMITNICLLTCTAAVLLLAAFFLSHDSPIPVQIPRLDAAELTAQKEANQHAQQEAARKARLRRVFLCQEDADCIIVDKDPCGCTVGPQGVVAINVNYTADFDKFYGSKMVTKACPTQLSREKECSPTARGVCKAGTCKIIY